MNNANLPWQQGLRYGLMGLPLAFVALPLYVLLPNHYAREFGASLVSLGAVLLAVRLLDTLIDPLLGRWADHLQGQPTPAGATHPALRWAALLVLALCAGFAALFYPPQPWQDQPVHLLLWLAASLLLTTLAYSALTILHQAWGARLGGNASHQSRVVAWRESLALAGVIIASIAPVVLGLPATVALLFVASALGWWAWRHSLVPAPGGRPDTGAVPLWLPWQRSGFQRLMAVFLLNGIASAVPATLLLFFVQDRLQAPASAQPLFLGSHFVCAALSIPLWVRLVPRLGLARTWLIGMVLAVLVFAGASVLGAGDVAAFVLVCALSGVALGSDLALPAALLAGVIQRSGDSGHAEGAYFGWWAFATKLNLALAAGLALPVLGWLGYQPGSTDPDALAVLTLAYCVLPCVLKTLAAVLLYTQIIRKTP
ncbi:MAG: MFS transporter [Rhodoferax sp.]|uniref:MFS transporter n=1 Tax=Rhodoferax sp. TaxID=50421 RepID=UPI001B5FCB02|nr:MFS transporter [Rhodoferax sp.]MBP9905959.1 MFS transporter [Rhodoferax sp.]